jgi:hypothetical protein
MRISKRPAPPGLDTSNCPCRISPLARSILEPCSSLLEAVSCQTNIVKSGSCNVSTSQKSSQRRENAPNLLCKHISAVFSEDLRNLMFSKELASDERHEEHLHTLCFYARKNHQHGHAEAEEPRHFRYCSHSVIVQRVRSLAQQALRAIFVYESAVTFFLQPSRGKLSIQVRPGGPVRGCARIIERQTKLSQK